MDRSIIGFHRDWREPLRHFVSQYEGMLRHRWDEQWRREGVSDHRRGSSWERQTLPSGLFDVGRVTCISATQCFALGEDGTPAPSGPEKVLTTTNAGATWQSQTFAQSATGVENTPIDGIACSGASCFGSGNDDGPAFYRYVKS